MTRDTNCETGLSYSSVNVAGNSLYLVKIRATTDARVSDEECSITLRLGYSGVQKRFVERRQLEVTLPVVCDSKEMYGQPGKWYEQAIFLKVDEISNMLKWETVSSACIAVCAVRVSATSAEDEGLFGLLRSMDAKRACVGGKTYSPFLGVGEAQQFFAEQRNPCSTPLPFLSGTDYGPKAQAPVVGIVGDDMFSAFVERNFAALKIGPESLKLIEANTFDVIVLQTRSTEMAPPSISLEDELKFQNDLAAALSRTRTPVLELSDVGTESPASVLKALRNSAVTAEVSVSEYELCNCSPVRGPAWNVRTIGFPCASDLYQYPEFQVLAQRLVENQFTLAISESNYDHVPARTWERFLSPLVKVYGRLSVSETADLFRNCGFVVLPGKTLRSQTDIANLAIIALMSGAIPIVDGRLLASPLDKIVTSVWDFEGLLQFVTANSSPLVRERTWLAKFRKLMRIGKNWSFRNALIDFAAGRKIVRGRRVTPSAEMICVTKRPQNFSRILDNFDRQSFDNLSLHLIWNVSGREAQQCVELARKTKRDDIRVSFLDETHNVGSCLNYGRRQSSAELWFKVDDDDYYGKNYIEDSVNYYSLLDVDVLAKPFGFIHFVRTGEVYMRSLAAGVPIWNVSRSFPERPYLCGATLSGRSSSRAPLFSFNYRNSCDSKWMESVRDSGIYAFASDPFNFVTSRGDPHSHTWQVSEDSLKNHSVLLSQTDLGEWYDAD